MKALDANRTWLGNRRASHPEMAVRSMRYADTGCALRRPVRRWRPVVGARHWPGLACLPEHSSHNAGFCPHEREAPRSAAT